MTKLEAAAKEYAEAIAEHDALRDAQEKLRLQVRQLEGEISALARRICGKQVDGKYHRNGNAFFDGAEDRVRVLRENLLMIAAGKDPGDGQ